MVKGSLTGTAVVLEASDAARDFYAKSAFGTMLAGGRVKLSLFEAAYLAEHEKITVHRAKKPLSAEQLFAAGKRNDASFSTRYAVFKDLRTRGYIVKTALKFGADFRVYDKGVRPGADHARWIVYPVHESAKMTWYDFAAKNRIAHGTKKHLLLAIVDDEDDVTYFEVPWTRP